MKQNLLFVALLWCFTAGVAHAEYLFTWEGNSNIFQGSFQVTDAQMQPGIVLGNGLALLSITSPDDTYQWTAANGDTDWATFEPLGLTIDLYDPANLTHIEADTNEITEFSLGGAVWSEQGSWEISYVPEPSSAALLALGLAAWLVKRRWGILSMP